jgi:dihydrodiol dehydrogenase / D-xylose 1-dehydrogenase (NADP)
MMPAPAERRLARLAAAIAQPTQCIADQRRPAVPDDLLLPLSTPLDVRRGLTQACDIHFKLRWGILSASAIASDWCKCLQDVPGAAVVACAARDPTRAQAFADDHHIRTAHASYEALVADPDVDIVYIGTKTPDHHAHCMLAISAGKHVLCEKPFTATAADAVEVFAAAEAKGLFCQEGMWLRFFPVYEHARAAIERGVIGDVTGASADYPDRCYAITPAVFAFGAASGECPPQPIVAAAGSACGGASGCVLHYVGQGVGTVTFPRGRYEEQTIITGSAGRIKILKPAHHPTRLEIYTGGTQGSSSMGEHGYEGRRDGWSEPAQRGVHVEATEYPLLEPAGERGEAPGRRFDVERGVVRYAGWSWGHGNQHGFTYQAQAVHRCLGAGLTGCPQHTAAECIHTCAIIDEVERQLLEKSGHG